MCRVWNKASAEPPEDAVYVGRPTKWGNPFVIGEDGTREEVLEKYMRWLGGRPDLIRDVREELQGKDLVCWCAPEPCHADVLLAIANPGPESDALIRELRLGLADRFYRRRVRRRCPYCGAWFMTFELLDQHIDRANRTGWCMGTPPPRDEGGQL